MSDLAPDGSGGWFAVWDENHTSDSDFYKDIYAQHCLANGTIDPGWPANGLPLCVATNIQQDSHLCADGAGGMFVAWGDYRSGIAKLYATHINSAGQRLPGWPVDGLPLSAQSGYQLDPRMVSDSAGGFFVLWLDYTGYYRGFIQHVTAGGLPAAGWPSNGTPFSNTVADQTDAVLIEDGVGGSFVSWSEGSNIVAQRFISDGPVPTLASLLSAEATPNSVALRWQAIGSDGAVAQVFRRDALHDWTWLGAADTKGGDYLLFTDRTVTPGSRYAYRLGLGPRGSESFTTESWVDVPVSLSLALAGMRPNPASHPVRVSFSLPSDAPAQLQVLDVSGRRVFEQEVGSLGAGSHVVGIESDRRLEAGMYWIRLEQQGKTLVARGAVLN